MPRLKWSELTLACGRLCERLGDPPELFPALFGLWIVYSLRGELRRAYELAEQLLRWAQRANDPAPPLYARSALGNTSFWKGELLLVRKYLEMAISLYDPERHQPLVFRYGGAVQECVPCPTRP
jgi:predicted ATPase